MPSDLLVTNKFPPFHVFYVLEKTDKETPGFFLVENLTCVILISLKLFNRPLFLLHPETSLLSFDTRNITPQYFLDIHVHGSWADSYVSIQMKCPF